MDVEPPSQENVGLYRSKRASLALRIGRARALSMPFIDEDQDDRLKPAAEKYKANSKGKRGHETKGQAT